MHVAFAGAGAMNYGLYTSAAGALVAMHRQNVLANNLANVNTPGYKPDAVEVREREPARIERSALGADPHWLLERLGGPVFAGATRVRLDQAAITRTDNPLDLAISGNGLFVVAEGDASAENPADLRFTRDGRLTLDARGRLVLAASGHAVLSDRNQPIELDPGAPVDVNDGGEIFQDGRPVGRLRIADADATILVKAGGSLLRLADGAGLPEGDAPGSVRQGFVEASAVDPVEAINEIMNAAKLATSNLLLMQYHDNVLGQAFSTFGRVA
jgi:flagellar basal body rod protein FlgG